MKASMNPSSGKISIEMEADEVPALMVALGFASDSDAEGNEPLHEMEDVLLKLEESLG